MGEHLYMLPSNMELKIKTGTVGYNNKILISDGKFILGKNKKVNLAVPVMKSHKEEIRKWGFRRKLPLFDHFCGTPMQ